jgi:glycerol uptake facilitator protein
MIVGPITGASLNPARAFGPELVSAIGGGVTHWSQLIPVYVLPGLFGFISRTQADRTVAAAGTTTTPAEAPLEQEPQR